MRPTISRVIGRSTDLKSGRFINALKTPPTSHTLTKTKNLINDAIGLCCFDDNGSDRVTRSTVTSVNTFGQSRGFAPGMVILAKLVFATKKPGIRIIQMFGMAGETEFDLRFYFSGIPVRVHPVFWLSSAWIVWGAANGDPRKVLIGILCIFVSVLVHELGHAIMSRRYGYPSEIVLYILGGYATATHFSTWKNVKVSAAGPGAGFVLFGLTYAVLRFMMLYYPEALVGDHVIGFAIHMMLFANLIVNIMNLVPCLPLDGGRIAEALMGRYGGRNSAIRVLQLGIIASALVAIRGVYCMNNPDADLFPIPQALFPSFVAGDSRVTWLASGIQPDPKFMVIFFGVLCAQHVISYNEFQGRR